MGWGRWMNLRGYKVSAAGKEPLFPPGWVCAGAAGAELSSLVPARALPGLGVLPGCAWQESSKWHF